MGIGNSYNTFEYLCSGSYESLFEYLTIGFI